MLTDPLAEESVQVSKLKKVIRTGRCRVDYLYLRVVTGDVRAHLHVVIWYVMVKAQNVLLRLSRQAATLDKL